MGVSLSIRTGDTKIVNLTIKDKHTKAPINITGRTYESQIRPDLESSYVMGEFICVVDADPTTGRVKCTLPANVTAEMPLGRGVFDIKETSPLGRRTVADGTVIIERSVTRD